MAEGRVRGSEIQAQDGENVNDHGRPPYGNLLDLNTCRELLDSVGTDELENLVLGYLDLLGTSSAVHEVNGDYALRICSSSWCRFLHQASRANCGTADHREALKCGKWACHESCWEASRTSMRTRSPVDMRCAGGLRIYAVPIEAGDEVVGCVNFGYGDPPEDQALLQGIASIYGKTVPELRAAATTHPRASDATIETAKHRLHAAAQLIGALVARQRAERRFRATFEQAAVGIAHVSPDGTWLRVNQRLCDILGYSKEELLARRFHDLTHPDDLAPELEQARQLLEGASQSYSMEKRYFRKDGSIVWINLTASLMRSPSGEPEHFIAVVQDISQRRQAEAALRRSVARFETLVAAMSEIVWSTTGDGRVATDLPEWRRFTGQSVEAIQGYGWAAALHPDDCQRAMQIWKQAVASRKSYNTEYRIRRHDGEYRWFAAHGIPVLAEDRSICEWIGSCQDIHDQKTAAETLEKGITDRTAQLEALNTELEAFSYSVSHDLRAPLRTINGFVTVLVEDHAPALDAECRRICSIIAEGAAEMGRLIDDLLRFSRMGRGELHVSPIDMRGMAKAVFFELTTPETRRRIDFRLGELPPSSGDPALLRHVWANLLSNAVKYSSKRDRAVIEVGGQHGPGEDLYFVKDNGVGFDMKYAGRLFGVFQRLHKRKEFEGTGVGLAIVQRIVRRHGGRVWAESECDKGATFSFGLPRKGGIA